MIAVALVATIALLAGLDIMTRRARERAVLATADLEDRARMPKAKRRRKRGARAAVVPDLGFRV